MNSFFKRIIAILATVAIFITGMGTMVFAESVSTTADAIRFGKDGKLRIMHVTDTHLSMDNLNDSVWLIGKACDKEKPNIIVLTGDIAMSDSVEETYYKIDKLMKVFEDRKIPVAVTFGNHDSENGVATREELMAYFNRYDCSISIDDGELLTGCGTYNVPVLGSNDNNLKFNLWVFDSGDYDNEDHYANVAEDQVKWYIEKSKAMEKLAGKKVNSLAFQHIIVPEVYSALKQVKRNGAFTYSRIYFENEYYQFDPSVKNYGKFHETPCCGYYNHGQFDAMVERGDVLAIFTGHDHTNAFGVRYKNIDIVNSLSTRYNGETFSTQYGYRMIEVDENNTDVYTSKVVHWYDFFNKSDMKVLRQNNDNVNLAVKIRFLGFFEKFLENISVFFVEAFTGRTVKYPD